MTDSLSLTVGDRVVYPNQGLCTVADIKTEEIAGQRLTFVSLVFSETGAKVKVPQEKLVKNGVRRVTSPGDLQKVFDFLKSDSEKASLDWKKRARDNTARLSEGGLLGLAEVVKGLQVLSELRPLPPKERGQYNDARHLFVEELAAALGVHEADAEDALDIVLFPVGKERPKRSVEEFRALAGDDDLGLGDLLGIPAEDGEGEGENEEAGAETPSEGEDEEGPEKPAAKGAKKGKKEAKQPVEEDVEAPPKKRGRPPKMAAAEAPPEEPKKRGRPPKAEAEEPPATPKKRGRPPKATVEEPPAAPKKPGRPPKAK